MNDITQYELANAMEKIKGYWVPRPNESRQTCFNRAKQEYINALKHYIEVAESIPENWENMILDKKAKI
jgi:hypothetical protein